MTKLETKLTKAVLAVAMLLETTALAQPRDRAQVAVLEDVKVLTPARSYDAKPKNSDDALLAMGRRIQEDATAGAPVETNLKASAAGATSCKSGEPCTLTYTIENTGKLEVASPILASIALGAAGGKDAVTKTPGWTCGYADPKLTCASTGIVLQPGERTMLSIDWTAPVATSQKKAKACLSFVWVGRSNEGVYRADQVSAVQYALQRAGFETGGIDGRIRPKTLQAIRLLRDVVNIPGPAQITPDLLTNLFGDAGRISNDADSNDDTACIDTVIEPSLVVADKKGVVVKPQETTAAAEKVDERLEDSDTAELPVVKPQEQIDAERKAKIAAALPAAKPVAPAVPATTSAATPSKEQIDAERKEKLAANISAPAVKAPASAPVKSQAQIDAERKEKLAASLPAPVAKTTAPVSAPVLAKSKDEIDAERKAKIAANVPPAKPLAAPIKTAAPQPVAPQTAKRDETPAKAAQPQAAAKPTPSAKADAKPAQQVVAAAPKPEKQDMELAKVTDRLEPTPGTPKSKTTVRSSLMPGRAAPVIAARPQPMPDDVADAFADADIEMIEKERRRAVAEKRYIRDEPLTIISTENEDELIVNRSAEEGNDGSYTVNRGDEGTYTPSRHRKASIAVPKCNCEKLAMADMPRAASRSTRPGKARGGRLPSGADIVAGWPYRN